MLRTKAFVKRSKKGGVVKVVREHYLRDDITCGCALCSVCQQENATIPATAPRITVIDTNIALHNMDVLAHHLVTDIVIPSTVIEEVRSNAQHLATRLRGLTNEPTKRFYVFANEHHRDTYVEREQGESPNDRNDRGMYTIFTPFSFPLSFPSFQINFFSPRCDSDPHGCRLVQRASARRHCPAAEQRCWLSRQGRRRRHCSDEHPRLGCLLPVAGAD